MVLKQEVADAFEKLGLTPDVDQATATTAYKKLALKHHPDRNYGDSTAHARFQEIGQAWSICLRHFEHPQLSQVPEPGKWSHFDFGGMRFSDADDVPLDAEEAEMFFMFMFAEVMRGKFSYTRGRRYREARSGAAGTGVHVFRGGFAESQQAQADNSRRQKKENEEYLRRVREFEEEQAREEAEAAARAKEEFKDSQRTSTAQVRAFQLGRSGKGKDMLAVINEYRLDVNKPQRLPVGPKATAKDTKNAAKEPQFETMLHVAASYCDETTVNALIARGADPLALNPTHLTPFHAAILHGNASNVQHMLASRLPDGACHPSRAARDGRTPLQLAITSGSVETVRVLVHDATVHDVDRCWAGLDNGTLIPKGNKMEDIKRELMSKKGFVPPDQRTDDATAASTRKSRGQKRAEDKARAEEEKRRRLEEEEANRLRRQARREAEQKREREAEERRRIEAEERQLQEAIELSKREEEARVIREKEAAERRVREERERKAAEERARKEAEERVRREAEERARREDEQRRARASEMQRKREAEEKRKEKERQAAAAFKAQAEAEQKAKEEAEAAWRQAEQHRLALEAAAAREAEQVRVREEAKRQKAQEEAEAIARREHEKELARIAKHEAQMRKRAEQSVRDKERHRLQKEERERAKALQQAAQVPAEASSPAAPKKKAPNPRNEKRLQDVANTSAAPAPPPVPHHTRPKVAGQAHTPSKPQGAMLSPPMTPEDLQTCEIPDDLFRYEPPARAAAIPFSDASDRTSSVASSPAMQAQVFANARKAYPSPQPDDGSVSPVIEQKRPSRHSTPCRFYSRGMCRRGRGCAFAHVRSVDRKAQAAAASHTPTALEQQLAEKERELERMRAELAAARAGSA